MIEICDACCSEVISACMGPDLNLIQLQLLGVHTVRYAFLVFPHFEFCTTGLCTCSMP